MDELHFLVDHFGGSWCGVRFRGGKGERRGSGDHRMPFCTAVAESRRRPIVLTPETMDCPGGSRSLGWRDDDQSLAEIMAGKTGMSTTAAAGIIRETPRLNGDVRRVELGVADSPDIFLSFAQPEAVMKCIRLFQLQHGEQVLLQTSGFMSVCGSVAVRAFLTGMICASFGCPDARENAGIGRDRLIIGIPPGRVAALMRGVEAASLSGR